MEPMTKSGKEGQDDAEDVGCTAARRERDFLKGSIEDLSAQLQVVREARLEGSSPVEASWHVSSDAWDAEIGEGRCPEQPRSGGRALPPGLRAAGGARGADSPRAPKDRGPPKHARGGAGSRARPRGPTTRGEASGRPRRGHPAAQGGPAEPAWRPARAQGAGARRPRAVRQGPFAAMMEADIHDLLGFPSIPDRRRYDDESGRPPPLRPPVSVGVAAAVVGHPLRSLGRHAERVGRPGGSVRCTMLPRNMAGGRV
ncbi:unnamed protein product [Prorocentrum cordatum]|uniref:Uncharacterized protein n=1 Tax=Prorocentrum cordatum TaxID=2364126 RepID=A0ABN9V7M8_9DINO|nr:unnamed protein product [Polarella glacialis]